MIRRTILRKFLPLLFSLPSLMSITIYVRTTHMQRSCTQSCPPAVLYPVSFFLLSFFLIYLLLTTICIRTQLHARSHHHPYPPTVHVQSHPHPPLSTSARQRIHMQCTRTITSARHAYACHCIHPPRTRMEMCLLAMCLYSGVKEVELE